MERGFADVAVLQGGFDAWKRAGFPVLSPPRGLAGLLGRALDVFRRA